MLVVITRGEIGLLAGGVDGEHLFIGSQAEGYDDLVAVEKETGAIVVGLRLAFGLQLAGWMQFNGGVIGDGQAAEGGERRISEYALNLVMGLREVVVGILEDEGGQVVEGEAAANGEAWNDGRMHLHGPAGESVNGGRVFRDFQADFAGQGAGDQVEGGGGSSIQVWGRASTKTG